MVMEDVKVTNMGKFYTLFLLFEKPHHGYEILKDVGAKLGKKASPGQIYPFLSLLEQRGYLSVKATGERDKKVYTLTKKGRKFVNSMLERFGDIAQAIVEQSVKKCAHCSCEIYRGGFEKTVKGKKLTFCCENCAAAFLKEK